MAGRLSFGRDARVSAIGRGCRICGVSSPPMSETLGLCLNCIRTHADEALRLGQAVHAESRRVYDLPPATPQAQSGLQCALCSRQCRITEGGRGYCGLRTVSDGRLTHLAGTARRGLLQWYRDPLPTNCVADWVCRGSRQLGCHNLAVFYASCTLNCLFCQNWHFRKVSAISSAGISAEQLADAADPSTFCVCFFGGDPASQMPHALAAGQRLAAKGVTVCWETAGTAHPKLLDRAVELSLASGGCVKFDLKAYDEVLHVILTGGSNRQTLENFSRAALRFEERPDPPLVVASTLLVPGYVDAEEVGRIARFIANLNPRIPYALLAFAPHFYMPDLPRTSTRHALEAERAAKIAGLVDVRIANRYLLSEDY
jgi:pyruvate formate lyase activating enzyme